MSELKDKTIYIILYNYSDVDYSIIKVMEKLSDAYEYICSRESTNYDIHEHFKLIEVNNIDDLYNKCVDKFLNICYIKNGQYNKFDLYNFNHCFVSNYAIIPMKIC